MYRLPSRNFAFHVLVFTLFFLCWSCSKDDGNRVDCTKSTLSISLIDTTPSSSCSSNDGIIDVSVTGGEPPYTFFVNDKEMPGPSITGVHSGIYVVRVKDKQGCSRQLANVSVQAEGLSFEIEITEDTQCLDGNGVVEVNVTEGTPPYQFKIGNGSFTGSNIFGDLNQGRHDLVLKDGNDCAVSLSVTIPKGFTGTSFKDEILPLIKTYCAKSGCHDGTDRVDLRIYSNAKKHAPEIKSLTRSREMPFEGTLTQAQIELFTCWVDDGALDN